MSEYQKIIPISNKILKNYELCDHCLGRLFSKQLNLSSNKLLGKKLKKNFKFTQKCFICKNLFDNLNYFLKIMLDSTSNYFYDTFSVGAIIKPSIVDRDDFIRSQYKLMGIDSIKSDITKELGKSFSKTTKKNIDFLDPEIAFLINFKDETCTLRSKSIILSGRYLKTLRGIPQKQKSCMNCNGKGCRTCLFHGISEFDSIEGIISQFLFKKFGGTTAKFTWIGGEDTSSLVLGTGRPFFVKIQNPHKRKSKPTSANLDSLKLVNLKVIDEFPKKPVKFISSLEIKISSKNIIDSKYLKKLKHLDNTLAVVYDKSGKRFEKQIFSVNYKKHSLHNFSLFLKAEGGLPIRRFIEGGDIIPEISQLLNCECRCDAFDFHEIKIMV
ncbi:MAG: pseudouridine synthase [Nitrosopumilus sp.]|nr:pseudouridine synthase [Nitrosopumilus sp.]